MRIRPQIEEDRKKAYNYFTYLMHEQTKPFILTQPRSNSQNALMWLWLTFIDKEKKNEGEIRCKEYWYAWFMQQYPIFYESSEVPKSSSNYDKEEMQQFLNNIDMHSSTEWGYELPDPNEKKAQDWFKYNGYNPDELYYKKTWNML